MEQTQTEQEKKTSCLNNNSLIPAINESERFIKFLDKKFKLNLPNNYIVVINKTSKNAYGTFSNPKTQQHFINTTQELNTITLNTFYIKECNPYSVLAHELTHFLNHIKGIKDTSANQYHNKHFKLQAENLLLKVERTNKGYNQTSETELFKQMLKEFKPLKDVFNVFQAQRDKKKVGSRLKLYVCSCGVKVRCAVELNAKCLNCNTEFKKEND